MLTALCSEQEIKSGVWSCESSKSPGPNGFNFRFIKEGWDVIKGDIFRMMNEFHTNAKLVRGSNPSFIVLIPKKDEAFNLNDFRPISLIGCTYKILEKTLLIG